jgi:hypothetical protein
MLLNAIIAYSPSSKVMEFPNNQKLEKHDFNSLNAMPLRVMQCAALRKEPLIGTKSMRQQLVSLARISPCHYRPLNASSLPSRTGNFYVSKEILWAKAALVTDGSGRW